MSNFVRKISDFDAFQKQWTENNFLRVIDEDLIKKGKALLTFRDNNATIYYQGRQLSTMHRRNKGGKDVPYLPTIYNHYLPIVRTETLLGHCRKENYLESEYINGNYGGHTFTSVLPEILDNMDRERDAEAHQVSGLYRYSPMVPTNDSDIILLDIEAAFAQSGEKTDRIDVVLFNKTEKRLIFVEVKRLSDSRLYRNRKAGLPPEILEQLNAYKRRISQESQTIREQYNRVIEYYECLTNREIPRIGDQLPLLGLLVVECTDIECNRKDYATPEFQALCSNIEKSGFKMYTYGDTKNIKPGTLDKIYRAFK